MERIYSVAEGELRGKEEPERDIPLVTKRGPFGRKKKEKRTKTHEIQMPGARHRGKPI